MRLGAYAVPINWHFKAEEVAYVLSDCGAKVLVAHADLLAGVADAIPAGVSVLVVETPPEVRAAYGIPPEAGAVPPGATDWETWLAGQSPWQGPTLPQTSSMIYTSGTTGRPKGVRRQPLTPEQDARAQPYRERVYGLVPGVRTMVPGPLYHSAPNAFALRAARAASLIALMPRFDPVGLPGAGGEAPHRGHVHGADHVRAAAEAPRRGARPLRPLLAQVRDARGRALPRRGQAGDDRVAGAGGARVLRLDRVRAP